MKKKKRKMMKNNKVSVTRKLDQPGANNMVTLFNSLLTDENKRLIQLSFAIMLLTILLKYLIHKLTLICYIYILFLDL